MQIVIDIPEELYDRFGHEYREENLISKYTSEAILEAFCKSTPLPAEHGNLVDINDVAKALIYSGICDSAKCGEVKEVLSKIPIVVEGSAE